MSDYKTLSQTQILTWVKKKAEGTISIERPVEILGSRDSQVGWTPVMLACQTGNVDMVRRLVNQGASLQPRSAMGKTAIEIAAENGHLNIVEELKDHAGTTMD